MGEREYTLRLTAEELCTVRFELDLLAQQHDQHAAATDEQVAHGFNTREAGEYWREQAALCRAVVKKAQAALDGGPVREV